MSNIDFNDDDLSNIDNRNKEINILISNIYNKINSYHSQVNEKLNDAEYRISKNIELYNKKYDLLNSQISDLLKTKNNIENELNILINKNKNVCPDTHVFNPKSNRCVIKTGKIGMAILQGIDTPITPKKNKLPFGQCIETKIFNPKTNRCINKNGKIGKKLLKEFGEDPNFYGLDKGFYMFKYKYKFDPDTKNKIEELQNKLDIANQNLTSLNKQKDNIEDLSKDNKLLLYKIKNNFKNKKKFNFFNKSSK